MARASAAPARELLLALVYGLFFFIPSALLGKGMFLLGALGASVGFGLVQGTLILGGQALGFLSGEWRGVSGKPRNHIFLAIGVLVVSMVILALGNSLAAAGSASRKLWTRKQTRMHEISTWRERIRVSVQLARWAASAERMGGGGWCFASVVAALVRRLGVRADSVVVFNEIMYHPASNEPALEWVGVVQPERRGRGPGRLAALWRDRLRFPRRHGDQGGRVSGGRNRAGDADGPGGDQQCPGAVHRPAVEQRGSDQAARQQ